MFAACTYFDKNYFYQGEVLLDSIDRFGQKKSVKKFILALDKEVYAILSKKRRDSICIYLEELERSYTELKDVKKARSKVEYIWTLTPYLIDYVFRFSKKLDFVAYFDADIFLFSDITDILKELGKKSVLFVEHDFIFLRKFMAKKNGRFNVGVKIFRNDPYAKKIIDEWKKLCIEGDIKNEFFTDQIFLDHLYKKFKRYIRINKNLGINRAPWNINKFKLAKEKEHIYLYYKNKKFRLNSFHFHQFFFNNDKEYQFVKSFFISETVLKFIYLPYFEKIKEKYEVFSKTLSFSGKKKFTYPGNKDKIGIFLDFITSLYHDFNIYKKKV